jgi:hypothetical protein
MVQSAPVLNQTKPSSSTNSNTVNNAASNTTSRPSTSSNRQRRTSSDDDESELTIGESDSSDDDASTTSSSSSTESIIAFGARYTRNANRNTQNGFTNDLNNLLLQQQQEFQSLAPSAQYEQILNRYTT